MSAQESKESHQTIRAIIVDDERLSRLDLSSVLKNISGVEVVGEAESPAVARRLIEDIKPDVIFLDIRMPEEDGLEFASSLNGHSPLIIFTTAVTTRALEAFSVRAVDYVLKPVEQERLETALERARALIKSDIASPAEPPSKFMTRLIVRDGKSVFFVKTHDLIWFESDQNYVRLHLAGASPLCRCALTTLLAQLDPEHFIQARRDAAVNLEFIENVTQEANGRLLLHLRGGSKITTSRSCTRAILDSLGLQKRHHADTE